MNLFERFASQRAREIEAISSRYDHVQKIYGDLLQRYSQSRAMTWCRTRLVDGIPEWLALTALVSAHATMAVETPQLPLSKQSVRTRGPWILTEPAVRAYLESAPFWDLDDDLLEATLEAGVLTVLSRHGAQARPGRGYRPGTFLRVGRAIGLLDLDVPHIRLIPE